MGGEEMNASFCRKVFVVAFLGMTTRQAFQTEQSLFKFSCTCINESQSKSRNRRKPISSIVTSRSTAIKKGASPLPIESNCSTISRVIIDLIIVWYQQSFCSAWSSSATTSLDRYSSTSSRHRAQRMVSRILLTSIPSWQAGDVLLILSWAEAIRKHLSAALLHSFDHHVFCLSSLASIEQGTLSSKA